MWRPCDRRYIGPSFQADFTCSGLCRSTFILRSVIDHSYRFLVIAQFDKDSGQFLDWFEANPFEKEHYWE